MSTPALHAAYLIGWTRAWNWRRLSRSRGFGKQTAGFVPLCFLLGKSPANAQLRRKRKVCVKSYLFIFLAKAER